MGINGGPLKNATISFPGAKQYSSEILNYKRGGVRIASLVNQGAETLEATYSLESWDKDLNDWIPEPLAIFEAHPAGIAAKLVDTFVDLHAGKYRVGIEPTAGTGPVIMSYSFQTEA